MNKIKRFLASRYGMDTLNRGLMVVYILFLLLSWITKLDLFLYLALAFAVYQLFRAFSSNRYARSKENAVFLKYWNPVKRKFLFLKKKLSDKSHRYFKCPECKTEIRVPKNKGKIRITCPKCRHQFIKKT